MHRPQSHILSIAQWVWSVRMSPSAAIQGKAQWEVCGHLPPALPLLLVPRLPSLPLVLPFCLPPSSGPPFHLPLPQLPSAALSSPLSCSLLMASPSLHSLCSVSGWLSTCTVPTSSSRARLEHTHFWALPDWATAGQTKGMNQSSRLNSIQKYKPVFLSTACCFLWSCHEYVWACTTMYLRQCAQV